MVNLQPNPEEAAKDACRALDCPICYEPNQLGQFIVEGNMNLMTWINNSIVSDEDPFSGYAADDDPKSVEAIQNTNLESWVSHAQYLMTGSRLEVYMNCYEPSDDDEVDQLPDKEIKPYIDFIDKHALAKCDLEVNDTDEVDLLMPFYDFSYSLRHKYERIILSTSIYLIEQPRYDSLTDLDELVKKFNKQGICTCHVFSGTECDILADGSLDFDNSILAQLDYVVASVHTALTQEEEVATKRTIKALENPYVTMLGHPSGRLLLKREASKINLNKVIDAAIANDVIIELNADPRRLDLDWRYWRKAAEKGLKCSINPDSHQKDTLTYVKNGIGIARKGWLTKAHVINTLSLADVTKLLLKKKAKAKI